LRSDPPIRHAVLPDALRDAPAILIIEADPSVRARLREALTIAGSLVPEATDVVAGVRLYGEHRPALVPLDMIMSQRLQDPAGRRGPARSFAGSPRPLVSVCCAADGNAVPLCETVSGCYGVSGTLDD